MLCSFLSFASMFTYSQSLDKLIKNAENIYKETTTGLYFSSNKEEQSMLFFKTQLKTHQNVTQLQQELYAYEALQYKKDIGLVFKATANYNFRNALDLETNTFNRASIRAELEWNILKNGYVHHRLKAKEKFNAIEALEEKGLATNKQLWRRQFRIDYSYIYNKEALTLFRHFLKFENEYFDFLNQLYAKKLIKREPIIKVGNQIHVLEGQIAGLEKENELIKDSVSVENRRRTRLPLFTLHVDSLQLDAGINEAYVYEEENIKLRHRGINDLSLSLYVNQNLNISQVKDLYFPAVGIRFRAPIRFNHRKQIVQTKIAILKAQQRDRKVGQYNRSITHINAYNEKLKDLKNQFKSWEVIYERIRILKVLKQEFQSEETGMLILSLLEERFKVLENILQIKRQLYTLLGQLFELDEGNTITKLIHPFYYQSQLTKATPLVVAKSDTYTLAFQIQYLTARRQAKYFVYKDDLDTQKYLKQQDIVFEIVLRSDTKMTVEKFIHQTLNTLF